MSLPTELQTIIHFPCPIHHCLPGWQRSLHFTRERLTSGNFVRRPGASDGHRTGNPRRLRSLVANEKTVKHKNCNQGLSPVWYSEGISCSERIICWGKIAATKNFGPRTPNLLFKCALELPFRKAPTHLGPLLSLAWAAPGARETQMVGSYLS